MGIGSSRMRVGDLVVVLFGGEVLSFWNLEERLTDLLGRLMCMVL